MFTEETEHLTLKLNISLKNVLWERPKRKKRKVYVNIESILPRQCPEKQKIIEEKTISPPCWMVGPLLCSVVAVTFIDRGYGIRLFMYSAKIYFVTIVFTQNG